MLEGYLAKVDFNFATSLSKSATNSLFSVNNSLTLFLKLDISSNEALISSNTCFSDELH